MESSKFQFKGFKIIRSFIEREDNKESSEKISLSFVPKGFINKKDSSFKLRLQVKIEDENKAFNIEIDAVATYIFNRQDRMDNLNKFFFINAPALLFPYIRAYISTLTNLSGFESITLPTLNMKRLGEDLKKNTIEEKA